MRPCRAFRKFALCAWFACGLGSFSAQAQMTIEVTGAGARQFPIAIAAFPGEAALPESIATVIRANLERSGLFRSIDPAGIAPVPTDTSQVRMADWRARQADFLAVGVIVPANDGRLTARVKLVDVVKGVEIGAFAYTLPPALARMTAHRLADDIYEKVTGEKGFFNTKIAYVRKGAQRFDLIVADADGQNEQSALTSREPIISPRWSPDGNRLAYVSFENRKPQVWVHEIYTSRRTLIANFRGSNSAPAWSPDGRELAVVLTLSGQSQLYAVPVAGGEPRRLASSAGIDTEPAYSPDGGSLFFTSDRGGGPQIYRMPAGGGEARRVTFRGSYNASPRPSPDGKTLAYITRNNGLFQVATLDLASGQELTLTDTVKDESPSFAPNGRMLLYATEVGGRGVLAAVSTDGRVKQRLSVSAADAREPAWGPFSR
jgi:TolB protein